MHEVPKRFAPAATQTMIGRQSGAAYIGMALLPSLAGALAQHSLEAVTWFVVVGAAATALAVRRLDQVS